MLLEKDIIYASFYECEMYKRRTCFFIPRSSFIISRS